MAGSALPCSSSPCSLMLLQASSPSCCAPQCLRAACRESTPFPTTLRCGAAVSKPNKCLQRLPAQHVLKTASTYVSCAVCQWCSFVLVQPTNGPLFAENMYVWMPSLWRKKLTWNADLAAGQGCLPAPGQPRLEVNFTVAPGKRA